MYLAIEITNIFLFLYRDTLARKSRDKMLILAYQKERTNVQQDMKTTFL